MVMSMDTQAPQVAVPVRPITSHEIARVPAGWATCLSTEPLVARYLRCSRVVTR